MALRLNKTVFIHIPKTGGMWITAVLEKLGAVREKTNLPHVTWTQILENRSRKAWHDLRPFAFVREPVGWYRSYWAFKMRVGWDPGNGVDDECQDPSFPAFVAKMVTHKPGFLGQLYTQFTKGTVVYRFETLKEDFLKALQEEGFNAIPDVGSINRSNYLPPCPPELAKAIEGSEAEMMKTWGYTSAIKVS